jgi:hypothetical protein
LLHSSHIFVNIIGCHRSDLTLSSIEHLAETILIVFMP